MIEAEDLVHVAVQKMQKEKLVMVAPVMRAGALVGLIRMHDIIDKDLGNGRSI